MARPRLGGPKAPIADKTLTIRLTARQLEMLRRAAVREGQLRGEYVSIGEYVRRQVLTAAAIMEGSR